MLRPFFYQMRLELKVFRRFEEISCDKMPSAVYLCIDVLIVKSDFFFSKSDSASALPNKAGKVYLIRWKKGRLFHVRIFYAVRKEAGSFAGIQQCVF